MWKHWINKFSLPVWRLKVENHDFFCLTKIKVLWISTTKKTYSFVPNRTIQCLYLSTNYELKKKQNLTSIFNFQFPTKRKLKIKYRISIFNYKKNKHQIWYQFSVFTEEINWNSDANFHISIFRLQQPVFISSLRFFLQISQRKPGTNKDPKVMKTIHTEFKGKCSLAFFWP